MTYYNMEKTDVTSSYFDLASRHFDDGNGEASLSLTEWLTECRKEGWSYEKIHHQLWLHDIPVSLPTVVRWCRKYI